MGGGGGGGGDGEERSLEFTPTWVVGLVCTVIVFISLFVERLIHALGKRLKKRTQKALFEALQKVKEELMLLGFISLLLSVLQGLIQKICISEKTAQHLLPCKREDHSIISPSHYQIGRRLLGGGGGDAAHCPKGNVPALSLEALHQLHIFIFVLAVCHVAYCALTVILSTARFREWKQWEADIQAQTEGENPKAPIISHVHQFEFIQNHFKGFGKHFKFVSWVNSFFKQFYGSVTKSDYATLRLGFIMLHCRGNPKYNFHKFMVRVLESDFKKVVGISWYLWVFVVFFLILNIDGWHTYFWIAFVPLIMLLAIGTKLEHVITQMAHEVAEKHSAVEGDLIVTPSDDHFWFHKPRIILYLIHFILFQNAFEIAFFFWILVTYGFDSCIMGQVGFIIPRLVIGVIIQVLCSYSTLPLYALVTQMGSQLKKEIFNDDMQENLIGWAKKAKKKKGIGLKENDATSIQMEDMGKREPPKAGPSEVQH